MLGCLRREELVRVGALLSRAECGEARGLCWLPVELAAMNSASAVDRATEGCFLLRQAMAPPLNSRMYAPMDRRVSRQAAQSESQKPKRVLASGAAERVYVMPRSIVPLR